jgi:hypothetical protein
MRTARYKRRQRVARWLGIDEAYQQITRIELPASRMHLLALFPKRQRNQHSQRQHIF